MDILPDDQGSTSALGVDAITALTTEIGARIAGLLHLVIRRAASSAADDAITELTTEIAQLIADLLALIIGRAASQSASAVVFVADDLTEVKERLDALEERARTVGGPS